MRYILSYTTDGNVYKAFLNGWFRIKACAAFSRRAIGSSAVARTRVGWM